MCFPGAGGHRAGAREGAADADHEPAERAARGHALPAAQRAGKAQFD